MYLTPHPLQRVGAFAVAALAGVGHPRDVDPEAFEQVADRLLGDVLNTAQLASAKDIGGWLFGLSYSLWPNSPVNVPARGRWTVAERRLNIRRWRALPDETDRPDAPCWLCGEPACGWYGKRDIPGQEAVGVVNNRPRGHHGDATCRPCMICVWAWPYGAVLTGAAPIAVDSGDEDVLGWLAREQVAANAPQLASGVRLGGRATGQGERDLVSALRACPYEPRADLDVWHVNNDNRNPTLRPVRISRGLGEFIRVLSDADLAFLDRLVPTGDARYALLHRADRLFVRAADRLTLDAIGNFERGEPADRDALGLARSLGRLGALL